MYNYIVEQERAFNLMEVAQDFEVSIFAMFMNK